MDIKSKNDWIDTAMNSIENLQPAEVPEDLYPDILNKINRRKILSFSIGKTVSGKQWSVAAAITILTISLNVYTLTKTRPNQNTANHIKKVVEYYQLTETNPLYNL